MTDTNTLAPTDAPDLLQIARSTGLRSHLQGVSATDARALLKAFVDALPLALASQPVAVPAGMEPVAHLIVRSAFRASPDGQDAESNEWVEEAQSPEEPGAFAVFTAAQVQAMLAKGIAPGWQAVPVEPTDAMTHIGQQLRYDGVNSIGAIYCAMLGAAPSGPVREPAPPDRVKEILSDAGYDRASATRQADFINGLRHGELEHGITAAPKGGQHVEF